MTMVSTRSATRKCHSTPSSRLNQIYHQDILTLLPRECVESRVRTVSRRYADFVTAAMSAGKLARHRYQAFEFDGEIHDMQLVNNKGFANVLDRSEEGNQRMPVIKARVWSELSAKLGCCEEEAQAKAQQLIGQCLFADKRSNVDVSVLLRIDADAANGKKRAVVFAFSNRLDATSAPLLVHFLHHLRDASFSMVVVAGSTSNYMRITPTPSVLNPAIFDAVGPLRLHSRHICPREEYGHHVDEVALDTLRRFVARYNTVRSDLQSANLDQALKQASQWRSICEKISFAVHNTSKELFESVVEHFESTLPSLNQVVSRVVFGLYRSGPMWGDLYMKWPSQIPNGAEQVRGSSAAKFYTAELVNKNSDERFRVALDEDLEWMELYFHNYGDQLEK